MKARIIITLKRGVLDPQGAAIKQALGAIGFDGVGDVRQGKLIELEIAADDAEAAKAKAEDMARKLLVNAVIEDFSVEIL